MCRKGQSGQLMGLGERMTKKLTHLRVYRISPCAQLWQVCQSLDFNLGRQQKQALILLKCGSKLRLQIDSEAQPTRSFKPCRFMQYELA